MKNSCVFVALAFIWAWKNNLTVTEFLLHKEVSRKIVKYREGWEQSHLMGCCMNFMNLLRFKLFCNPPEKCNLESFERQKFCVSLHSPDELIGDFLF